MNNSVTVELTPIKYLERENQSKRNHLSYYSRQSEVKLKVVHDQSNMYDSKALQVFYDDVSIGYIRKRYIDEDLTNSIDNLFFSDNQMNDIDMVCSNSSYTISKMRKKIDLDTASVKKSKSNKDYNEKKILNEYDSETYTPRLTLNHEIDALISKTGWIRR